MMAALRSASGRHVSACSTASICGISESKAPGLKVSRSMRWPAIRWRSAWRQNIGRGSMLPRRSHPRPRGREGSGRPIGGDWRWHGADGRSQGRTPFPNSSDRPHCKKRSRTTVGPRSPSASAVLSEEDGRGPLADKSRSARSK
jgi:hypothetical protein